MRRNTLTASGNLSPIADSPPIRKNKKRVASTNGNDLDYSDDNNDFLLSDEDLDLDAKCIKYMDTKKKGSGRRRGNLILGGPEQKDTSKMTEDERREYRKSRKECTDRQRFERMRRDPLDFLPSDQFTGDCTPTLRTESEVQAAPLLVGHSFALKDILVLRVVEEANLRGIECSTTRSDIQSFKCTGHRFLVEAHHSEPNRRNVKVCATREGDDFPGIFVPVDDVNHQDLSTPKKSPYRSEWIKDLISNTISEMPSASNQVLRQQLMAYGKPYAITDAIIQAARTKACAEIFGDANKNCKYVHHIKEALEKEGHIVKLRKTSRRETIQNVERIVIHDELLRLKQFNGSTMLHVTCGSTNICQQVEGRSPRVPRRSVGL
jgi:hypothetical protein